MKTSIKLILIILLCSSQNNSNKIDIPVQTAMKNKSINCTFKSTGKYKGKSILCTVVNLKNTTQEILIPNGTYFIAENNEEQNLITIEDKIVCLKANEKKIIPIDAYCTEINNKCPTLNSSFTLSKNPLRKWKEFIELKNKYSLPEANFQEVIWCISDQAAISNIVCQNNKNLTLFREKFAELYDFKNVWYDTPQQYTVNSERQINFETVKVEGDIKFKNTETGAVFQTIEDKNGKVLFKNESNIKMNIGNITYQFSISVSSWEKGDYFVKLYRNNKNIHSQEFHV
ncbi:MAG: hypothetical protein HYU67_11335 [Flavobacteriia bacterium]|nr:hypothetical protein [Flavobacteriia bacterium]